MANIEIDEEELNALREKASRADVLQQASDDYKKSIDELKTELISTYKENINKSVSEATIPDNSIDIFDEYCKKFD